MKHTPIISVIICTYNREDVLPDALDSLVKQTLAKKEYEIIVVDNNSTDNTRGVVESWKKKHSLPVIHYLHDPIPGAGQARNTGVQQAQGKFVAFMDDDARAKEDWLEKSLAIFARMSPQPTVIGGPIFPFYLGGKPEWFKDEYETFNHVDNDARFLTEKESFAESNMIFRKDMFLEYGGFDTRIGMIGDVISSGEERELFDRIRAASDGNAIFYSPELIVYHLVPAFKMNLGYRLKRSFAYGQSWYMQHRTDRSMHNVWMLVKYTGYFFFRLLLFLPERLLYHNSQQWLAEKGPMIMFLFGFITTALGINIIIRRQ